jgi:cytochrome c oxidase cbb3-type subunit 3
VTILLLLAVVSQHAPPAVAPGPQSTPLTASRPADVDLPLGSRLFARNCAVCHGPSGEGGKGPALAVPRLSRPTDFESLGVIVRRGIDGTEMPSTRLSEAEVRAVAGFVLSLGEKPIEPSRGDARRGEGLYRGKGGCAACHTVRGEGGALGPDLTDVGRRRGAVYLERSLREPDADVFKGTSIYRNNVSITENFLFVRAVTRGGQSIAGVRVNEDTFSIQLRDAAGTLHSLLKADLRELQKEWGRSPMPGYSAMFSTGELQDVIAYLLSLR